MAIWYKSHCVVFWWRIRDVQLSRLGITTPGVCLLGFSFYFISSLCPSFALAKASRPTNNKISGNTALRGTKCPGDADKFFFWGQDWQDPARSYVSPSRFKGSVGRPVNAARSHHRIMSRTSTGVYLDDILTFLNSLWVDVVCCMGYEWVGGGVQPFGTVCKWCLTLATFKHFLFC